jgi:hypothetical protein
VSLIYKHGLKCVSLSINHLLMSDPQIINSSQAGETTSAVDKDQPTHRHDHGSGAHFSPLGTAKLSPGADSSAPPHQDTSNSSPGVFASALHNATETIKQYLPSQHRAYVFCPDMLIVISCSSVIQSRILAPVDQTGTTQIFRWSPPQDSREPKANHARIYNFQAP